jgi:hypothetical protein
MKIFLPIMLCLLFLGGVYLVLGLAEKSDISKFAAWPVVDGQVLSTDMSLGGVAKVMRPPTGPMAIIGLLFTTPQATYSYQVKGQTYQGAKKLWPSLTPVRLFLFKDELAKRDAQTSYTMQHLSDPNMYKIDVDAATGKATMPNLDKLTLAEPPVKVHYDPTNPSVSSLDPSILKPADTLFLSGVWMLIVGAVGLGLLKFHSFVTAPSPEPEVFGGPPGGGSGGNWKRV